MFDGVIFSPYSKRVKIKISDRGFGSILLLFIAFVCFGIAGFLSYRLISRTNFSLEPLLALLEEMSKQKPLPTFTPFPTPTTISTSSAQPKNTGSIKPTSTPFVPVSSQPISKQKADPIVTLGAVPPIVSVTTKRADLYTTFVPTIRIYSPGTKQLAVIPNDGSVGIFGLFKGTNSSYLQVQDNADIEIGITNNLKNGVNSVVLQVKEGATQIEAFTNPNVLINIPVSITITE